MDNPMSPQEHVRLEFGQELTAEQLEQTKQALAQYVYDHPATRELERQLLVLQAKISTHAEQRSTRSLPGRMGKHAER